MRRSLFAVLILVFVFSSPVLAEREVNVVEVTGTPVNIMSLPGANAALQPCQTGNLNPIAFAITGFAAPPEEYKYYFVPQTGCASCGVGFTVNMIHILMRTSGPCDIVMAVDVEAADPNDPACPGTAPGVELCNSGVFSVSLPGANIWDVAIPINCSCLTVNAGYLLSFEYLSSSCLPEPDLITDGLPTVCTSWNNFGSGWVDLVTTFGFPGNLSFYADADCCDPVPVEANTWGGIKALFEIEN